MDDSMNLSDFRITDDIVSSFDLPPANFDNSFSIGEIMQQQSVTAIDPGSGVLNASATGSNNLSYAAEQSSRHLIVAALPKTTSA
jgi:hypothetical protein